MNAAQLRNLTDEELVRVARDSGEPLVLELLSRFTELADIEPPADECPQCGADLS